MIHRCNPRTSATCYKLEQGGIVRVQGLRDGVQLFVAEKHRYVGCNVRGRERCYLKRSQVVVIEISYTAQPSVVDDLNQIAINVVPTQGDFNRFKPWIYSELIRIRFSQPDIILFVTRAVRYHQIHGSVLVKIENKGWEVFIFGNVLYHEEGENGEDDRND